MQAETLYVSTVFFAGVLSFLSPCVVPLLPVYLSVLAKPAAETEPARRRLSLVFRTLLFVAGISVCFVVLGFGAGALGGVINSQTFLLVAGAVVILLGIHQTGLIKLPWLNREKRATFRRAGRTDALGVFLLGLAFSFGWTPCIGPVLAAILGLAAGGGAAFYGAFLMAVYALGFAIPFLVLSLFSDVLLAKIKRLQRHLPKLKVAGGVLIILMGLLLMTNRLHALSAWIGG
jgi:cytochrome c-type biogenesis protein